VRPAIKVGLSTASVYPLRTEAAFESAAELGFDGVELMVWAESASQDVGAISQLSRRYDMPVLSVHAPCLLISQRVWGADPIPKLNRSVQAAERLGAQTVVVHPPFRWQRRYADGFGEQVAWLEERSDVHVAVENMFPFRADRFFGSGLPSIERMRRRGGRPGPAVSAFAPSYDPLDGDYAHYTLDLSHTATAGTDALDMAMSGHVAFGPHHLTVMCFEESLPELEKVLSLAIAELVNLGINPVREKFVMEQAYWAQLPGNFDCIARGADISTMNLAGFASLHNYPIGRIANNHWGDAVTVFDTSSGTPYYFNFHNRDVGHTTIIGPTGAGKTVLLNFLCAQAQKFNCRIFIFDKDKGAEIFIRAIGGKYTVIEPGKVCHFNPLLLPDTPENRTFLGEWLHTLVTVHDEPFTAEDMDRINEAVAGNFKLDRKDRMLRNIAPFMGIEGPGTLAGRLRMWHSGGPYSGLFDNEIDVVDFSKGYSFGFDMGEVLKGLVSL
jgi:sugar phosphate isomerase/epimerase